MAYMTFPPLGYGHKKEAKAMTAPRYTAEQLEQRAKDAEWSAVSPSSNELAAMLRQAAETERALEAFRLRQAAETERALEAFRAWLAEDEATPFRIVLEEFDRRFGRTP